MADSGQRTGNQRAELGDLAEGGPRVFSKKALSAFGSELELQKHLDIPDPIHWRNAVLNVQLQY